MVSMTMGMGKSIIQQIPVAVALLTLTKQIRPLARMVSMTMEMVFLTAMIRHAIRMAMRAIRVHICLPLHQRMM
jgi:hypothetical protein